MTGLTLRARVALLVAVAVGLAVALAAAAAYVTMRHELLHELDASLVSRAESAAHGPLAEPGLLFGVPSAAFSAADVQVAIVRSDGTAIVALAANPIPLGPLEVRVAAGERARSLRTLVIGDRPYRLVAVPIRPGFALVLARPLQESDRILGATTGVLLIVGLVGIGVAASAGLAVARTGLAPVERLTAAAEHIARTGEIAPIDVGRRNDRVDEISRLALAFNAMLAALADSRDRQRRLVADAGHELRTPLTSLRTNLDLLVQAESGMALPPAERAQLLADVRAQVTELSGLVTDLVELAREEGPAGEIVEVDLAGIVTTAVERARRRASRVSFDVDLQTWPVRGDAGLLERAVTNLLDNAVKWSPDAGTVHVQLCDGVLRVADDGPGIPVADRPHVFDRFYRAPDARPLPGSGLGLAIVRQVAETHGGSVRVENSETGGARLALTLPRAAAEPTSRAGSGSGSVDILTQ
ncbi:MAG: HAMP domain-containing sensor histidine kinase [Frankiaceae bacterium]